MKLTIKRAISAVTMVILAAGVSFALAACGGTDDKKLISDELDKVLGAFKNPTAESLSPYVGDGSSVKELEQYGVDYVELFQHLFKHFDYTINDVQINGDTATAKVSVTNVDLQKVVNNASESMTNDSVLMSELMAAYSSGGQEAMYKIIFNKMFEAIDSSTDLVTSDAELKLTKSNGKWEVDESSLMDFVSKVYGGLDLSSL